MPMLYEPNLILFLIYLCSVLLSFLLFFCLALKLAEKGKRLDKADKEVCRFFQRGGCMRGNSCNYMVTSLVTSLYYITCYSI